MSDESTKNLQRCGDDFLGLLVEGTGLDVWNTPT